MLRKEYQGTSKFMGHLQDSTLPPQLQCFLPWLLNEKKDSYSIFSNLKFESCASSYCQTIEVHKNRWDISLPNVVILRLYFAITANTVMAISGNVEFVASLLIQLPRHVNTGCNGALELQLFTLTSTVYSYTTER